MRKDRVHLKAPGGWINDPNGFIYYKGQYHLFYQHFPYAPRWATMHWGHAVSRDLVHWEHQGVALYPTVSEDQNGCFSGSAIEHEGKLYLYYTGVHYNQADPDNIHQCLNDDFDSAQLMLTSPDGVSFDVFHGKRVIIPAITDGQLGDKTHTRDPKVWRGKDAWYLVIGSKTRYNKGELLFYRSENLIDWEFVNKASKEADFGWMWECPDYFETEGGKVLVISPMGLRKEEGLEQNHTICMPVEFEEKTCTMELPDEYQYLDYGLDLYAPQTTLDEAGRRVLVAWLRMPEAVDNSWIGMFCIPRVVEVKEGHIYFRVHPNVKRLYTRPITRPAQADGAGYKISCELEEGGSLVIGGYRIRREGNRICTDRSRVFPGQTGFRTQAETPELKEGFKLDIYVDTNLIEIFMNDGEYVLSSAVYGLTDEVSADRAGALEMHTIAQTAETVDG